MIHCCWLLMVLPPLSLVLVGYSPNSLGHCWLYNPNIFVSSIPLLSVVLLVIPPLWVAQVGYTALSVAFFGHIVISLLFLLLVGYTPTILAYWWVFLWVCKLKSHQHFLTPHIPLGFPSHVRRRSPLRSSDRSAGGEPRLCRTTPSQRKISGYESLWSTTSRT